MTDFVRRGVIGMAAASAFALGAANAQETGSQTTGPQTTGSQEAGARATFDIDDILAVDTPPVARPAGAGDAPSELDLLSQRTDNPFAAAREAAARAPASVTLRALNKITARYVDIEAAIGDVSPFGSLEIVPRYCDKRPPEEFPETTAFLQIFDMRVEEETLLRNEASAEQSFSADNASPPSARLDARATTPSRPFGAEDGEASSGEAKIVTPGDGASGRADDGLGDLSQGAKIFSGWMFASSPALNPLEHPVYDIWVIDCKTVSIDGSGGEASETSSPR